MTTIEKEILFWTLSIQHWEHMAAVANTKKQKDVELFYLQKASRSKSELEKIQNG